jgi:hypothetical protein
MTINDSIKYLVDKALTIGYSEREIEMLTYDLKEILYGLPDTDQDTLDELFEEMF